MSKYRRDWLSIGLLFLLNAFYCHRFFGTRFRWEGDAVYHLYFRMHEALIRADHNPFQWHFTSLMSFAGLRNPVLFLVRLLFSALPFTLDDVTKAVLINMVTAFLSSFLLSASVYWLVRFSGRSRPAGVLAGVIVAFTGLHTSGIREFNYTFQSSFMFVAPLLIAFVKLREASDLRGEMRWMAMAGIFFGLSLLGGSNVPLFYFLPFFGLLPLLSFHLTPQKKWWRVYALLGAAIGLGFVAGLWGVAPSAASLEYSQRGLLRFNDIITSATLGRKLCNLVFRDWWLLGGLHYHEQDYFLGLPVVVLVFLGLSEHFRSGKSSREKLVERMLLIFLLGGIVITFYDFLPTFIGAPIGWFYEKLSIRNSNRFFLMWLLPAAYYASLGLGKLTPKRVLVVSTALLVPFVYQWTKRIEPVWALIFPDTRAAATLSMTSAAFAIGLLIAHAAGILKRCVTLTIAAVYAMYFFAPIQDTAYLEVRMKDAEQIKQGQDSAWNWRMLLGLEFRYNKAIADARRLMTQPPKYLQDPKTLEGRVMDLGELDPVEELRTGKKPGHIILPNYHAPYTGHRFAFAQAFNPLSSEPIGRLAGAISPGILDLYNVCWMVPDSEDKPAIHRPTCLPEAFFVPAFKPVGDDVDVLNWVAKARVPDFLGQIALNCNSGECADLVQGVSGAGSYVEGMMEAPDRYRYRVRSKQPGFLFTSLHYRKDWRAEVGGLAKRVLKANYAFMAVPVAAGESEVVLKLGHDVARFSGWATFASFFLMGLILIASRCAFGHFTAGITVQGDGTISRKSSFLFSYFKRARA